MQLSLPLVPYPRLEALVFDEGLVLIRPGDPRLYVLNPSARLLWETLSTTGSPAAMAQRLADDYGIPLAQAQADCETAIQRWRQEGLLAGYKSSPCARPHPEESDAIPSVGLPLPQGFHHTSHYRVAGQAIQIRWGDTQLAAQLQPLFAALASYPESEALTLELYQDATQVALRREGVPLSWGQTVDQPLAMLLYQVLSLGANGPGNLAVFHAAGVADERGAVLLAGTNGSGKSTLCAALCQTGWQYLGEDLIPLAESSLQVRALPTCLCLKRGSWPVLSQRYPALADFAEYQRLEQPVRYLPPPRAAYPQRDHYPVACLLFPRYRAGVATTLRPISALAALQALAASNSSLPDTTQPKRVMALLEWLAQVPSYALEHGDLETAVALINGLEQR